MESKLDTLSTVITVSGVISSIIITLSGLTVFTDLCRFDATAGISGMFLLHRL